MMYADTAMRGGHMFRKILVAIDGSQQSNAALAVAVDLAQHYRASLCLLHAFPHVSDLLGTPQYEHLLEARSTIGQQILESTRAQITTDAAVEAQLIEGPPAPAILRVAVEDKCDMIVMGSRGHGQLAGMLLGSVSSTVAQRANCPVLIVH
jgi:nucleotide-binding universal stress UspA family protein